MPLPRAVARFNRRATNPVARRLAGRLPPFAIVGHVGRRSGRAHRTPVMLFGRGERVVIALTYGPEADWVKNVVAAGHCTLETGGKTVAAQEPRLIHGERPGELPRLVRAALRLLRVEDYLMMQVDR